MFKKTDNKGDLIICRCEEVTKEEVLRVIADGARSINAVKKRTRAGMGFCQGKVCGNLVRQILAQEIGQKIQDLPPGTYRPPIRPIKVSVLGNKE